MIAISSARDCKEDSEYKKNQVRALGSWLPHFDKVIYVGKEQEELKHSKVCFCPSEEFPKIRDLVLIASNQKSPYSVIINADIYLHLGFMAILPLMQKNSVKAGVSRRLNYHPSEGLASGKFTDLGFDVFVAQPGIWRKVYKDCPKDLRIGHIMWDTWLSGWMNSNLKNNVVDFSHYRCVYHPVHGGRKMPFQHDINYQNELIKHAAVPGRRLG